MTRRIMHIDLDTFFVSVERVLNPELIGKPVVVGGKPDQRGVVSCASYEARVFGLHAAMPLITAGKLCPQAIFVQGNFSHYREYSHRFMSILSDFSPSMEPVGIDEAYLEATGFESLHGSAKQMAQKIKGRIKTELGICASIGISSCKVVSKITSALSKPDGLIEVLEGDERVFLAPLPVTKLPGVGKKTEQIMNSLGIKTIGQLADLPVSVLTSRFGVYGESLHRHASGIDDRLVEPRGEAKSISRETTFKTDTRDKALLDATLRYLSEKVGSDLREDKKQAKCIALKLRYSDFTTISRQITLTQSGDTDQSIYEAGLKLMERELQTGRQKVRLLGIGVSNLTEPSRQLEMLNPQSQRLEKLNLAIDRIRDRYGFSSIQTGRTLFLKDLLRDHD